MKDIAQALSVAFVAWVIIVAALALPALATIWAINQLCGPVIPYNVWTWLAVMWLTANLRQSTGSKGDG